MANPIAAALSQLAGAGGQEAHPESPTALLDALIARGQGLVADTPEVQSATPLEGYPQLPNPDPNSAPPLYGEIPGEGYLFARDPEFRQSSLIHTDPEIVRVMLLRAMEVAAFNAQLPFNEEGAAKCAEAALKFAQAYLLIDPNVDATTGVNIATQAALQAATAAAQPPPAPGGGSASGGAHGTVKKGPAVGGHQQPPRVMPGAAAQAVAQAHEQAQEVLQGSRPSRPLPKPRPGA